MKTQNGLLATAAVACSIFIFIGSTAFAKTAKDCIAEWRADKAGMQARGVRQKAYVEQCKAEGVVPTATAPEIKPTAPAPAHKQESPATQPSPAQPAQKPAPTITAAPVPKPSKGSPTLEAGQFADEASAKARCLSFGLQY